MTQIKLVELIYDNKQTKMRKKSENRLKLKGVFLLRKVPVVLTYSFT